MPATKPLIEEKIIESAIWAQSLCGRAIDLVAPTEIQVDFREIAETLARINRYNGAAHFPVSVAQHTIIAFEAAEASARQWVLLHDAHEARTGDITTPVAKALERMAAERSGLQGALAIRAALKELKRRHDVAIHAAARLPMPGPLQRGQINEADLIALRTERRDFLTPCPQPWQGIPASIKPSTRVYRPLSIAAAADKLFELFKTHLPALIGD